jgi:hypothetical protein
MRKENIKNMIRGWFVGNFDPTVLKTNAVEVGVKEYKEGDYEEFHHHRVATEITYIIEGKIEMNGVKHKEGDIIIIEPFEGTDFRALTKVKNVVVKFPGAVNDKYIGAYRE